MKTIYLKPNYYNALKLHWAGLNRPSKIAEKCNISVKKYHQLIRLTQSGLEIRVQSEQNYD